MFNYKTILISLCSLVLIACEQSTVSTSSENMAEPTDTTEIINDNTSTTPALTALLAYKEQATALQDALTSSDNVAELSQVATELSNNSIPILDAFAIQYPECAEYLTLSKVVLAQLDSMSSETIETQYHDDGALPQADIKCYHAKDLLVHPATVVILLREGKLATERTEIGAEIAEVLAHLSDVKTHLQKAN